MNDEAMDRDDAGESFDDDALADALAAQTAFYTSPISVIRMPEAVPAPPQPAPAAPPAPEPLAVGSVDAEPVTVEPSVVEPAPAPSGEVPAYEAPTFEPPVYEAPVYEAPSYEAPSFSAPPFTPPAYPPPAAEPPLYETPAPAAEAAAAPTVEPAAGPALSTYDGSAVPSSAVPSSAFDLSSLPDETTIDRIERLEGELRRRGFTGETPVITPEQQAAAAHADPAGSHPVEPDPVVPDPVISDYQVPEPALPDYFTAPVIPDYMVPDPELDGYVIDEPVGDAASASWAAFAPPEELAPEPAVLRDLPPPVGQQPAELPPADAIEPPSAAEGEEPVAAPRITPEVVVPDVDPTLAPTGRTEFASMLSQPPVTETPVTQPPSAEAPPLTPPPLVPPPLTPTSMQVPPTALPHTPPPAQPSLDGAPSAPPAAAGPPPATAPADLDETDDDAVDEVDRVGAPAVATVAADVPPASQASAPGYVAAPASVPDAPVDAVYPLSAPIPTQRVVQDTPALVDEKPQNHPVLMVETAGDEPTVLDLRAGRAVRLFWLWFATNSSVLSLALGAILFTLGMSLRQTIVAILAGVALSFLPLGLGTLAGKWSGQPTMIISRASFGHLGNVLPAALAVLTRVFWGGVLLWLIASSTAQVLTGAGLDLGLGADVIAAIALLAGAVLVGVVALIGYGFVARINLVLSIASAVLVAGVIALTASRLDIDAALATADGSWVLVLSGAVLVFSVIGLAWVHSSGDIARYQRPGSSGGASMLWATFGATLPPFALIVWGAMLAASDPELADGFATAPLATLASLLPNWYPAPLLLASGLGLISGSVLAVYSGGFALKALGSRMPRYAATILITALAVVVAIAFVLLAADTRDIVRDITTTLAVPVAAWAGIFSAETMIRSRRFHAPSLLARGGLYPDVRLVNLLAFVLLSVVGFAFTSGSLAGFTWQGYGFRLLGIPADSDIASSDVGVLVALVLALVVTFATAVPTIRRQESEPLAPAPDSAFAPPAPVTSSLQPAPGAAPTVLAGRPS